VGFNTAQLSVHAWDKKFSGEPDAENLHVRFDEGRVGRTNCVALSPTLLVSFLGFPMTRFPDFPINRSLPQRCFTSSSESTWALSASLWARTMSPSLIAWRA